MATQRVTVNLPDAMYEQLRQRAVQSQRTVEAELLEVVSTVMPVAGKLTPDLAQLLNQLQTLDDKALWQLARRRLSKKAMAELQTFNYKRQREGLTEGEAQKANRLLWEYERVILVRAKAISLLKERDQDISEFQLEA